MEIREVIETLKNNNEICRDGSEGECPYCEDEKCYCAVALVVSVLEEYIAIGTVEECQEAREKQIQKKPNITTGQNDTDKLACCPTCDSNVDWTYEGFWRKGKRKYCHECGQAIDWSEE